MKDVLKMFGIAGSGCFSIVALVILGISIRFGIGWGIGKIVVFLADGPPLDVPTLTFSLWCGIVAVILGIIFGN